MATIKTLPPSHLDRLVNANQPVYVLNTSALTSGDKGMIVVNFFDGTRRDFFKMPPTFIPIAVSDSVPSSKLKESRDFKQCLLKGMLTLVDPASAENYLASEEAQDEYESLVLSEHSAQFKNIDVEREVSRRTRVAHQTGVGEGPVQDVSAVDTISNKVRGVMESLISNTLSAKEALVQLRRHQSALGVVDFSYIAENSTDAALTKWAKNATLRATADYEDEEEYEAPKKVTKKRKSRVKKPTKRESEQSFDFSNDDAEMTADEAAADAAARSAAQSSQDVHGRGQVNDEINKLMKG